MILDGKIVASKIYSKLQQEINELVSNHIRPNLAVICVGEDSASQSYIQAKQKAADNLGLGFRLHHFPGIASENQVSQLLVELNQDKSIHGIIVQLPLPEGFDTEKILKAIDPQKDIDGFSGRFTAPTALAIYELLKFYRIDLKNKKIVIIGYGRLVGQPLKKLLTAQGFEPLVCDSRTNNLARETRKADILISATGAPGLIKENFVKDGVVLIDAGTAENNGKIIGDIDSSAYQKAKAYTPVPGGVGPVTVACLMRNLVEAIKKN